MVKMPRLGHRLVVFLAITLIFIVASGAMYIASSYLVQAEFSKIENRDMKRETAVAVDALQNRINQMAVKNSDWSNWDDSYQFIVDRNQAYIQANLVNQSLTTLGINFMLFYNAQHKLVWAQGADAQGNPVAAPRQLLDYFSAKGSLFCDKTSDLKTGVINLPSAALMFAARPILRSDETGPSRGTLFFGEYLSSSEIKGLANLTHLNLGYYRTGQLPPETSKVGTVSASNAAVRVLASDQIAGYQMVNDYFGQPLLMVRVIESRDAFLEAQRSLRYFMICIAAVTLLSMAVAMFIANQVRSRDQTIQLKNEFFSIASHEIRTPLAAIKGNSALLMQEYGDKNDTAFSELVSDIREASTRLIRLVTNYLDVARLDQGKVPLNPSAVDVAAVVASVVAEMQGLAADHNLYIRSEIQPGTIPPVWADLDRVKQIVYNLIGNAAKFTEQGGITIMAEAQPQTVKVLVVDTGRGISPEGQKVLFHKFQQTKSQDGANGTGLGLYISKLLVNLMGGEIRLESSEVGKGSTMSFTLPVASESKLSNPETKNAA